MVFKEEFLLLSKKYLNATCSSSQDYFDKVEHLQMKQYNVHYVKYGLRINLSIFKAYLHTIHLHRDEGEHNENKFLLIDNS